jgi:hypothetical protein
MQTITCWCASKGDKRGFGADATAGGTGDAAFVGGFVEEGAEGCEGGGDEADC